MSFSNEGFKRNDGKHLGPKAPENGTLTGSDSDLRKLSTETSTNILLSFGVAREIINACTNRWGHLGGERGREEGRGERTGTRARGSTLHSPTLFPPPSTYALSLLSLLFAHLPLLSPRWQLIDLVRKLATAAAQDGSNSDIARKYTRAVRSTLADQIESMKASAQKVWDVQLDALSKDAAPRGAERASCLWLREEGCCFEAVGVSCVGMGGEEGEGGER
jgi:hypothetical protein